MTRTYHRAEDAKRPCRIQRHFQNGPAGSVLIETGSTKVICAATVEERVPYFLRGTGEGWIAAEYALIPSATGTRTAREAVRGRQSGRTQEIERLIGRSLRSVVDLRALGERTILIDCDVIQADGGTRTASVTGAFVALVEACSTFYKKGGVFPVRDFLSAISVGIAAAGTAILDLDYEEDAKAIVDMNVVMAGDGRFVEVQGTGEGRPFSRAELGKLLELGEKGCRELISYQKDVLGGQLVWLVGREG
ncbi:ribonuclease PH [Mitsuokella sp. oral taxon 131]|uniref:ribonuclease PH n=1 Tax=Mitsuokella sp. oral taxon 131 TaxID=1321780 RepID=UPI0003AE0B25|nr:ribonuclease PH [Mitsuokella sp. oral taxon 131]ERL05423.1 tRNA nucleotidyltransferase [Mitsuokella sp. oral taxon 131 str. W9106]